MTNYFVVDYAGALKRPLAETDASGNITRYYVWAGFQLLAHIEANGTVRYYHGDELGSTLALTDEAGTTTDQFAYAPYGELLSRTGTNSTAFLWLGGYGVYYDSTANLHLTLHRAYSAEQKRFISPDPMGIDGGVNLYAYGDLNPLAFIDPYGLYSDNGFWSDMWDETRSLLAGIPSGIANLFLSVPDPTYGFRSPGSGQEAMNNVAKIMADLAGTTVDEPNFQKGQFIGSFLSGNWLFGRMFATKTSVVIGENMDRVGPYASRIGAETFKGTGMEANRLWIQEARDAGRQIIDIGPDFTRRAERVKEGILRPDSPFYNMERMETTGYENYLKVFERTGRYEGRMP